MLFVATLSAVTGAAMQHLFGVYVDIPVELVYTFQGINAVHLGLLTVALMYSGTERQKQLPLPIKVMMREQERYFFSLFLGTAATFSSIAFYEFFLFGVVVFFAAFPLLWMIRLVVVAILEST